MYIEVENVTKLWRKFSVAVHSLNCLNCFKGDVLETSERRGGAHMDSSERMNWTELR